ncbi:MAG: tetratricopeptide repeat protein [Bdellovibrionales bacterium]|nr:tetratricopeptide repeat protein [Bdellovibrionales bacterium]
MNEGQNNPKNPLADRLAEGLQSHLTREGMELVDFVAVPTGADKMVRYRTIQEVLTEFENGESADSRTYVLHIRKQRADAAAAEAAAREDAIYLPNGKLNSDFLANNAKILFQAGDYAAARQIYLALTKSGERTAEGLLGLARCFEAEGKTDKALRAYDDSILYSPSIDAYRRYASLLIRTSRDQQAAEVLERAMQMKDLSDKHRYDLHQAAGNAWLRSQAPAKAERHYRKALEYHPHSDAVATNLGTLCLGQKRYDEAKIAFEESLRVNPQNDRAWFGMGSIHLALGEKKAAHDAFASSLRIKIQQPQAIFHLVKTAYEIREYPAARDLLRTYVEMSPFNANLLYSLAGLEYHLGDRLAAARTARTILQIQPSHAEAANLLGLIEKKL